MREVYDPRAPRKLTRLSINRDLLSKARECGLNLSTVLEAALVERIVSGRRELWLQSNWEAIDAYNADIERDGVFSVGLRSF